MKIILKLCALSGACFYFSSCTTTMYTSNSVNAPLLKSAGEVKVNATQTDLQAAVAATDHFGIMANGFYKDYEDGNYKHNGYLGEIGLGYYSPLNDSRSIVFETYGGVGMGKVFKQQEFTSSDNNSTYIGSFEADAGKLFIQPSIGYSTPYFDLALTPRFSLIKYTSFSSSSYPDSQLKDDYLYDNEITRSPYIFAEPAVTMRTGYKFIKFQFQYGLTLNMGNRIRSAPNWATLGLVLDIGKWYNK